MADKQVKKRFETNAINTGTEVSQFMETSEPIYMNSGFVYSSAEEAEAAFKGDIQRHVYARFHNPTSDALEARLAILEGGEACRVTGSGMSAIFTTLMGLLEQGDHIVAARSMFSSSFYIITEILPRFNIKYTLVDDADIASWKQALSKPTKLVLIETPTNPTCEILDVKAICELAHFQNAQVIVDNAFASPALQRPIEQGADIIIHSTTKYIDGHGRALGGAIIGREELFEEPLGPFIRHTGPNLSPFNAWCMLQGLETLSIRIDKHCQNAMKVAEFLNEHKKTNKVYYPGLPSHKNHNIAAKQMDDFGGMLAFEVMGGKAGAFKMMNALKTIHICNNLGDTKSLICHPFTSTHASMEEGEKLRQGITEGLLRYSVGIENADDILEDLDQALSKV
ncbi:MAG: trans-sulfuration enzyme family protein [Alphaproteobacteria bacterium]